MKCFKLLSSLFLSLIFLNSCDNLDLNERLIPVISDPNATNKNILIEDFTGQRCSNCPLAHEEVSRLQNTYGTHRIVAVAIHGGPQAIDDSSTKTLGLANKEGKEYNRRLGQFSYPKGIVDRKGGLVDFEKWAAAALSRLSLQTKVNLQLLNMSVDTQSGKLSFQCQMEGSDDIQGHLQLWLTESGIEAIQDMPAERGGETKRDYMHHHVFRATVNGQDGEPMSLKKGQSVVNEYNFRLDDDWLIENLSVVAFFYNDIDGVVQVVDSSVIARDDEQKVVSIKSNGLEVAENATITYKAHTQTTGEIIAGHETDPLFTLSSPHNLTVKITIPNEKFDHFQWNGIEQQPESLKTGTYIRTVEHLQNTTSMQLQAYFKKNVYDSCKVKVEVDIDGKHERTFYLNYVYEEKSENESDFSILYDGEEIPNGATFVYHAKSDLLGDIVGGAREPLFTASIPCKLDVKITIPQHELSLFRWCGIAGGCYDLTKADTYTRTIQNMKETKTYLDLHAYFKKGVFTSSTVNVEVFVDDKLERSFNLQYDYKKEYDQDNEGGGSEEPVKPLPAKISIKNGNLEILEGEILEYEATNGLVVGNHNEFSFSADKPCKLSVTIDIPHNQLDHFQWKGITQEEQICYSGTYTRVVDQLSSVVNMQLFAHFRKEQSADCCVTVKVRADEQLVRTFYMKYKHDYNKENLPDITDYADPSPRSSIVVVAFTGQNCSHCTRQGKNLQELQQYYGKNKYIIAAHHNNRGYSYFPNNHGVISLFNEESEKYAKKLHYEKGLPHVQYNSLGIHNDDRSLNAMFDSKDLLECSGTIKLGEGQYHIDIKTRLRRDRTEYLGKEIDILFWVLENDVIAFQNDNGIPKLYYTHQHIFRKSLNGIWGQSFRIGENYKMSYPIPELIKNPSKTDIIVLFLDHYSGEILDAESFSMN